MASDIDKPTIPESERLMSEILVDIQLLVEQQLKLIQLQMEKELRDRVFAIAVFSMGLGLFLLAAIQMTEGLVHLLHWMVAPPNTDPGWFPLWACESVVMAVLALTGFVVTNTGRRMLLSFESHKTASVENIQDFS